MCTVRPKIRKAMTTNNIVATIKEQQQVPGYCHFGLLSRTAAVEIDIGTKQIA
jgi:hypothetical protein